MAAGNGGGEGRFGERSKIPGTKKDFGGEGRILG